MPRTRKAVWENWRKSLVQIFLGLGFLISGLTVIILPWILFVTNRPIDSQQMRVFAITTPLITIVGLFFAWAGLSGLGVIDYIRRKWTKGEVFYAVTDSRVLVLSIGLHAKVIALSLTSIKEFFSQNNFDGTGSLLLVSSSGKKMELTGLKEVERVRDVIKQQQSLSRETSG